MGGESPILFTGKENVPDKIRDYIKSSQIEIGVLIGNDLVLRYHEMKPLFERCGFNVELLSVRLAANPDRYFGEVRFGRFLPSYVLRFLLPIFPSQYFLLRKT